MKKEGMRKSEDETQKPVGEGWNEYYKNTADRPPSQLLTEAIQFVEHRSEALDLGAGALKDTRFLVEEGFEHITAVDRESVVQELGSELPKNRVEIVITSFDGFPFPKDTYDLISAQFSLPFNGAVGFDGIMKKIKSSLKEGGIFTGQFFGDKDQWNTDGTKLVFHTEADIRTAFADMDLLSFKEVEHDSQTADGAPKHWHVFNVIAKRRKSTE